MSSKKTNPKVYPYIPNSVPATREQMLQEIGVPSVEELYQEIPKALRLRRKLNLPEPFRSEFDLRQHVESLLAQNKTCQEYVSFLGAGAWRHYVPAVCDEINSRSEFVTAYSAPQYSDHGKHQAMFETQSMIGELVGMDVCSSGLYDWTNAASSAMLMGARIAGRREILIPRCLNPEKRAQLRNFSKKTATLQEIQYDPQTGKLDLNNLRAKISAATGAVYFEPTNFCGVIDDQGAEIGEIAHQAGAQFVVGVDAISLGVLEAPGHYGADIVCGELQPLGIHLQYGGGLSGFIATKDEPQYIAQSPTQLYTITAGSRPGETGFAQPLHDRTSYVTRDTATDFTGTTTGLWFITAGVYLALMGPQGLQETDQAILAKSQYAIQRLAQVKGVRAPRFSALPFKEFVVNFDGSGKTVREINQALLGRGIFGGWDLSPAFPELGQSALFCVTEVISQKNIDQLVQALSEVLK